LLRAALLGITSNFDGGRGRWVRPNIRGVLFNPLVGGDEPDEAATILNRSSCA